MNNNWFSQRFNEFASRVSIITGSPITFIIACLIVLAWGISGPVFHYSDTWQLVINTGTTIITFLMVFVIQHSQNRDTLAMQLKLNELIAANKQASNRLLNIEDVSEDELAVIKEFYAKLSTLSKKKNELHTTHSVDEENKDSE